MTREHVELAKSRASALLSSPEKGEQGQKEGSGGKGGFIAPSHGLTVSTEHLRLQKLKTKGGRKRNLCLDKHKVEKVIGQGIWAPRTFSNHKFSIVLLKSGNLSWLLEMDYPGSRQGQFLASSPVPTLSLLWPWSMLAPTESAPAPRCLGGFGTCLACSSRPWLSLRGMLSLNIYEPLPFGAEISKPRELSPGFF